MERYMILDKLGEGNYGKVYKVIDHETGTRLALRMSRLETSENGISPMALREISRLHLLCKSVHVLRLVNVEQVELEDGNPMLCLAFEYVESDLKKFMYGYRYGPTRRPIPPEIIKKYLYQLCKGVAHCHRNGVLHRNLKPQNLLIDEKQDLLKIAQGERGFGRAFSNELVNTLWYRAPEVLLGTTEYSTGVDMWAVGCIFAEMAKREELFPGDSEKEQLRYIFRLLGTPTEKQWPGVTFMLRGRPGFPRWKPQPWARAFPSLEHDGVDLLSRMLKYDPARRISAAAALEHAFFDNLDKSQL